jgi:hypothetical protein
MAAYRRQSEVAAKQENHSHIPAKHSDVLARPQTGDVNNFTMSLGIMKPQKM